jgi:predicted nucleotide-binding protein
MAKKPTPSEPSTPELLRSCAEVRGKLDERIGAAETLLAEIPVGPADLEAFEERHREWTDYNEALLTAFIRSEEVAREYNGAAYPSSRVYFAQPSFQQKLQREQARIRSEIACLRSISGRLDLYPVGGAAVATATAPGVEGEDPRRDLTRAFIVHGHDDAAREAVARVLESLEIEPVILNEQANRGMTVIEKLERYGNVGFAVVLLTLDDEGRKAGIPDEPLRPRARQNVVLELGYFVGLLKRERVCALYKPPLELPSDYDGVLYVPMDDLGAWKLPLAHELKAAGYRIDMNKLA